MRDLTEQVDMIILGGGQAAAAALARDGVSVVLCDLEATGRGLQGALIQPFNATQTPCVARLFAGGGVRVERSEQ